MTQITDKYNQLRQQGVNLGADLHPGTPDTDAGYGGTFRQYQKGNIYFHSGVSPVAHEVHGSILTLYLAHGGPGVDAATGKRLFGFPKSDEIQVANDTPMNSFEWGAIYLTQGTAGVTLTGAAYQTFLTGGGEHAIGLPISSNAAVAGGEAIYGERGIAWVTTAVPNGSLIGRLTPPLLGAPLVMDPTPQQQGPINTQAKLAGIVSQQGNTVGGAVIQPFLPAAIHFDAVPKTLFDALTAGKPTFFSTLWTGRLSLVNTATRNATAIPTRQPNIGVVTKGTLPSKNQPALTNRIALDCVLDTTQMVGTTVNATCRLAFAESDNAEDSTLYDMEFAIPGTTMQYRLSPHCVYLKKDWTNFGILHITDLHLSLRNEQLRAHLNALGLPDGAANYANCQDQFRDFIRYANHLHASGLAHAVMATGDLVDYIGETGDDPYGPSNYERFRNMLLGDPFDTGVQPGEELLLPIFTTFGNHDHRLSMYDLHCVLSVEKDLWEAALALALVAPLIAGIAAVIGAVDFIRETLTGKDFLHVDNNQYGTFNLKETEAGRLQGGVPIYDAEHFSTPLQSLKQATFYPYWDKYFGPRDNKVALGPHRLVILDSGGDSGVPASASPSSLASLLINYLDGNLPRNTVELTTGCPNSFGYSPAQLDLLRSGLAEAGSSGLVIVGVHLPPVAPAKGYNNFYRETEHPTADPSLIENYVAANGMDSSVWIPTGTPHFATGDVANNLDFGIGTGHAMDLLKLCAGAGTSRPIDVLLCGHHHDRIEYRVRWDQPTSKLQYFMDFYTENPATFYETTVVTKTVTPLPSGAPPITPTTVTPPASVLVTYHDVKTRIIIDSTAPLGGSPGVLVQPIPGQDAKVYQTMHVRPYANPLNSSADAASWWQSHRPVLMQTAALGPIDPCQRFDDGTIPEPTFQGFRLLQIGTNTIQKIRYVTMKELRTANFVLPWETETSGAALNQSPTVKTL